MSLCDQTRWEVNSQREAAALVLEGKSSPGTRNTGSPLDQYVLTRDSNWTECVSEPPWGFFKTHVLTSGYLNGDSSY